MKEQIFNYLYDKNFEVYNLGTNSFIDSVDYPDFSNLLVQKIKDKSGSIGILICGTGIGMSIAANRHDHIRAALCTDVNMAELSRKHNNANVLVLGGRILNFNLAKKIVVTFTETDFEFGRHELRLKKVDTKVII